MTQTRRSAVLPTPRGQVTVIEQPRPEPGPDEVLVRMEACGICHSDVFVAGLERLPLTPLTLGHEGIGRVEQVGSGVTGFQPGDRAGITFLAGTCCACALCRAGAERFCPKQMNFGYTRQGVLADWATVRAQHLVHVPETLNASEAAPLCCAGWTAYGAVRESGLQAGAWLGLFGMGGLGHLALAYARHRGLHVAAVDVGQEKLQMAAERGAEFTAPAENAGRILQKELGGVDAAVVLAPSPAAIEQAFRSVKRTGAVILVGLATAQYQLPIVDTVLKGISVRGSFLGTRQDLDEVFALAATSRIKPHITTHALDEAPSLLEKLRQGQIVGRAVIVF